MVAVKRQRNSRMRMMLRYICLGLMCTTGLISLSAQELNATVKVNSAAIQGTSREVFLSLEESLRTLINGRRWSDDTHQGIERINCSFTVVITEAVSPGSFRGELYVQSRRFMHNNGPLSPMLHLRDRSFDFDYSEYQPLTFDPNDRKESLSTTIAFYAYLILGLEYDSRTPLGGTACFRQMQQIAAEMQSSGWSGWDPYGSQRNRSAIAAAFNDGSLVKYRQMWYDYHTRGLDQLTENADEGREKVRLSLPVVASLFDERPSSVLILLFGDAKLGELVSLFSNAGVQQKRAVYTVLRKVYPARSKELEKLR